MHRNADPELVARFTSVPKNPVMVFTMCMSPFESVTELIPAALTEAIDQSPGSWRWIIRLHYKMDDRTYDGVKDHFRRWSDKVEVQRSSEYPLYDLFNVADYHLTLVSTTALEAEAFGLRNIILGEIGRKQFGAEIDGGIYFYATSAAELLAIIEQRKEGASRTPPIMETDPAITRNAIIQLMEQQAVGYGKSDDTFVPRVVLRQPEP